MIGDRIAELRKEKKWTQRDLAKVTGLSRGYIASIEEGNHRPKIRTLAMIADALDVTVDEITSGVTGSNDWR